MLAHSKQRRRVASRHPRRVVSQAFKLRITPGTRIRGSVNCFILFTSDSSQVGADVIKFRVGDSVAVPFILSCGKCRECGRGRGTVCEAQEQPGFTRWGSFAQRVSIPRADLNLAKLPEGVSFAAAAAMGCRYRCKHNATVPNQGIWRPGVLWTYRSG